MGSGNGNRRSPQRRPQSGGSQQSRSQQGRSQQRRGQQRRAQPQRQARPLPDLTPTAPTATASGARSLDAADHQRAVAALSRGAVPWWAVLTAIAVAVALGVIVHWIVGVVVGVAVVATIVVLFPRLTRHASPDALAALIGGVPADEAQHPRLVNLLEQLGVSVGATTVQAKVVNCDGANIAAWGAPTEGRIAVTTGLLDTLNRVETEAVLAEALWRVRSGDAELAGLVAAFQSGQALSTSIDQPAPDDWDKRRTDLLAPFGEHREIDADLGAVGITRYPPALRSALAAMQERGTVVTGVTWGTAHLWMCDPTAGVVGLHQPVGLRLDVLAEL